LSRQGNSGHGQSIDGSVRLFATRDLVYFPPPIGSIPLLMIAVAACGEERKAINFFALSA
jgi:hypothetical protein